MPKSLRNVEIFAVGRWKGNKAITVTSEDLDEMVRSFTDLSSKVSGYKPFLKLGHQDQQKYFGQKTGAPNLGFVERIWRDGNKIIADFSNIPDDLLALIEQRRYNSVSIEMYPSVEHEGQTFKNVLTAVALLGAELPAVKGLRDLAESLFSDDPMVFGDGAITFQQEPEAMSTYTQEQLDRLTNAAVQPVQIKLDAATTELAELKAVVSELKTKLSESEAEKTTAQAQLSEAQEKIVNVERAALSADIASTVETAIKDGKLTPAQKDHYIALGESMASQTTTVKLASGEVSGLEAFKKTFEGMSAVIKFGAKSGQDREDAGARSASEEVDRRTRAKMSEKNVSYSDAKNMVFAEDPELKTRYAQEG
jgi:hypothetical protein